MWIILPLSMMCDCDTHNNNTLSPSIALKRIHIASTPIKLVEHLVFDRERSFHVIGSIIECHGDISNLFHVDDNSVSGVSRKSRVSRKHIRIRARISRFVLTIFARKEEASISCTNIRKFHEFILFNCEKTSLVSKAQSIQ